MAKLLAIFIPTLNRSDKLQRVVDNIRQHTPVDHEIYFIVEGHDTASAEKAIELGAKVIVNKREKSYAGAINTAYEETSEDFFFTGADDLDFHINWFEMAVSHMSDKIGVVGTNDLGLVPIGPERDSTHYLIARKYIQEHSGVIDIPNQVLYPYEHNYTDKEFVETAKKRGMFVYVPVSVVEHYHPVWNKAQWDEVYQKGRDSSERDRATYQKRQSLWQ